MHPTKSSANAALRRAVQSSSIRSSASAGSAYRTGAKPAPLPAPRPRFVALPSSSGPSRVRSYATASAPAVPTPNKPHFDKILIANRGEIACRVIRTAKKLGIRTVAVYSEADADSLHVKIADEAYCIGPAQSAESYLRMDKIIDVCHKSGAQAVHPGYGFLSETATFAEKLAAQGLVFIGPPASAITSMGSKSESKTIMIAAGVPCVPGYHGTNQDPDFLLSEAEKIGFPVLIKAVHGGGGKGMRTVDSTDGFKEALVSAQREAQKSFGNSDVLVEKFVARPRHVEVQVFADMLGNAVSLWERDCSVQRRNQKIIEEAPAPGLSPELRADLCDKAVAAAKAVNYVGAGTVEFIFDKDTEQFYFMEMNTRLQVEHPVSEMITGLDLVEWQLEVAAGNALPLTQSAIPMVGHAFEARIYAENPRNNFLPDSGRLLYLSTPDPTTIFAPALPPTAVTTSDGLVSASPLRITPSVRLEQGFGVGAQIGVFYDPMIAKLVIHAEDRAAALRVLRKALEEYRVVGVSTNVEFLRALAGHEAFIAGEVETGFIPKYHNELFPPIADPTAEVLAQAALFTVLRDRPVLVNSPWSSLDARRFNGDVLERTINLQADADNAVPSTVTIKALALNLFDISVTSPSGQQTTFSSVSAHLASPTELTATLGPRAFHTTVVSQRPPAHIPASASHATMERLHIFADGARTTLVLPTPSWLRSLGGDILGAAAGSLRAPMPSLVVELKVTVGDRVQAGDPIVVLESMKTETVLRAPKAGTVRAIACTKGEMVEEGKELVDIEDAEAEPSDRLRAQTGI